MIKNNKLPFIDGIPEDGQKKFDWIKDGEFLSGFDQDEYGNLNKVNVQLQENIKTVYNDVVLVTDQVNTNTDGIIDLKDKLDEYMDDDIINTVVTNTSDISELKSKQETAEFNINTNTVDISKIATKLGSYQDATSRTITEDLFWIKEELGNYVNEDINGNVAITDSSGLKHRVITNTESIKTNSKDIKTINDKLLEADLVSAKNDINKLISDLGVNTSDTTAFLLIDGNTVSIKAIQKELASIVLQIESIVVKNGSDIKSIRESISTLDDKLLVINSSLESLRTDVDLNTKNITDLSKVVNDPNGLVDNVSKLTDYLGNDKNPISITDRVVSLEESVESTTGTLQDIQITIGSSDSGIVRDLAKVTNTVGDSSNGLVKDVRDNTIRIDALESNNFNTDVKLITDYEVTSLINKIKSKTKFNITTQKYTDIKNASETISEVVLSKSNILFIGNSDFKLNTDVTEFKESFIKTIDDLTKLISYSSDIKNLYIITPFNNIDYGTGVLSEYIKVIKEVSYDYGIPLLDLYGTSGINKNNHTKFIKTGLLNEVGSDLISTLIVNFLNQSKR